MLVIKIFICWFTTLLPKYVYDYLNPAFFGGGILFVVLYMIDIENCAVYIC